MDLDFIESFVVVAEVKSFSKAAEQLHITQPTITARIQSLERELGVSLFYRKGREVKLTECGELFLTSARKGLAQIQEGMLRVRKKAEEEKNEVRIGATNPFAMCILPYLIPEVYKNFPDFRLTVLRMGYSAEVVEMVKRGDIEVGFVNEIVNLDQVHAEHLFADPILLVTHPTHPWVQLGEVPLSLIEREPVLYLNSHASYWKLILTCLQEQGIELQNKIEINNVEVIKNMVMEDPQVVTLLPRIIVQTEALSGQLKVLPVTPVIPRLSVSMVYQLDGGEQPLLRYMAEQARERYNLMERSAADV